MVSEKSCQGTGFDCVDCNIIVFLLCTISVEKKLTMSYAYSCVVLQAVGVPCWLK